MDATDELAELPMQETTPGHCKREARDRKRKGMRGKESQREEDGRGAKLESENHIGTRDQ
jgi:hypothetical protein